MKTAPRTHRLWLLPMTVALLGGCLGEPELEDRWTRIDIEGSSMAQGQSIVPGTLTNVTMRSKLTYRRLLTGFLVAEVRASATVSPADVIVYPDADRETMARHVDYILANSVGVGRATRAVTGWDHLIQEIDFDFNADVPGQLDSAGVPIGAPVGVFLLCYMATGVEIEIGNGQDSLVITPMPSGPNEVLHIGMELTTQ